MRVFHLMQVAQSALFRAADRRARAKTGLTFSQLAVLFVLQAKDGQPIGDIAATLAMGKSSLTGLIDRICEKGLVRRSPSAEDGRVTLIHIEPAGHAAARAVQTELSQQNAAVLAPFSPAERDTIASFLQHLADNAETIINGPGAEIRPNVPPTGPGSERQP